MNPTNVFEFFRKSTEQIKTKTQNIDSVLFLLDFDNHGSFLRVIDKTGNQVEASYLNYGGAIRHVLRLVEEIQERNSFLIDWEKPNDELYLAEYEHLMEQLRRCDNLVDSTMRPITFAEGDAKLKLDLHKVTSEKISNAAVIKSNVIVEWNGEIFEEFRFITDEYLLAGFKIIHTAPIGGNYNGLSYFNTTLKEDELTLFLSLFFSNVDQIEQVNYEDFRLQFSEERIHASPSLIFEKIDADESLIMRVGQSLPDVGVEMLNQFELYRFAEANDLERVITVKYIEREPIETIIQEVEALLKKQTPKKRAKTERAEIIREGELFIIPQEIASNFIYNELPELLLKYQLFGAEKLKSYKIATISPTLSMNLTHNIDFFEGEVTLNFDGEKMNLFEVLNQYNKNKYVQLSDGTHALVNEKYIRRLERIFKKKDQNAQISFFDMPLVEEIIEEKITGEIFQRPKAFYNGLNQLSEQPFVQPPVINATLRPYQEQGVKWLKYLQEYQLGGCLADDMGLGKTLQTIALLASVYQEKGADKPSLIVMPKSLLYNWEREVAKFAPQLSTYVFHTPERDLELALKKNLIFTTYSIARNEIERLKDIAFLYVILDESQNIKNINALTTKAIMLLQGDYRLALSGTPVENNLGELYSLFRFLNPTMFGTTSRFTKDYLTPIQKSNDKLAMQHLRKKIYPFILRRLKRDVLQELPDKIEQVLYVEMSDEQRTLYDQRRQFYQYAISSEIASKGIQNAKFFIFQALNELRQIASLPENMSNGKIISPKRELLQEQLMDTIANGHKALVFANYLNAIELIGETLDAEGIDYVSMTGATRDRQKLVDRFQNDPNCKVFIMTLKTGGTGLNLTAADTIFIFDPWWNVAAENQAIDRSHRFGQVNKVLAYKLITQNTIEEKILQLQQVKKELFDNIIESDSSSMKSLSEEDIDFILGVN